MKKPTGRLRASIVVFGLSLLTTSFFCTSAEAIMITLEPDDYAVGTNVTNLFEGVTINRLSGFDVHFPTTQIDAPAGYSPVYVQEWATGDYAAATGTHTFGIFFDLFDPNFFSSMVLQFDRPTNFVEVTASYASDYPFFIAFDSTGQRVAAPTSFYGLGSASGQRPDYSWAGVFQIGSMNSNPSIQTVVIAGQAGNSNLDTIRYNSVPEPSSLLLFGIGLAGVAAWRKRQQI